jgi:acetyl esterase
MVDLSSARRAVGAFIVDGFFRSSSRLARMHPLARPERHGVELLRDIPYRATGKPEHLLDVYRPRVRREGELLPAVLYVHGGGFRILSKDSHWIMALQFSRHGYTVFNVNYRLGPLNRYPAALEDLAEAYAWVVENAARFGGDPSRLIVAGESAGANLVASMTLAATYERSEPFAKRIFDTGVVPVAAIPACGIFQVTDVERLHRRKPLPSWLLDRLLEVSAAYLPDGSDAVDLADPVVLLERHEPPSRPLPPFFIPCGTKDPLLDDSRRLGRALAKLGVRGDVRIYPGEPHAFHALVWRDHARACWREKFAFLDEVLRTETLASGSSRNEDHARRRP